MSLQSRILFAATAASCAFIAKRTFSIATGVETTGSKNRDRLLAGAYYVSMAVAGYAAVSALMPDVTVGLIEETE